jgi:hypothetical protein
MGQVDTFFEAGKPPNGRPIRDVDLLARANSAQRDVLARANSARHSIEARVAHTAYTVVGRSDPASAFGDNRAIAERLVNRRSGAKYSL